MLSIQEGIKKLRLDSESFTSLPNKRAAQSNDYIIPRVIIDSKTLRIYRFRKYSHNDISIIAGNYNFDFHAYFLGTDKKLVMKCYNFLNRLLCFIHFLKHYC